MTSTTRILLVVVGLLLVVGLVTAVGVMGLGILGMKAQNDLMEGSKAEVTKMTQMHIREYLEIHALKNGKPPSEAEGLAAAFDGRAVPKDGWGNAFFYTVPGPGGLPYELISYGADGVAGGTGFDADILLSEAP